MGESLALWKAGTERLGEMAGFSNEENTTECNKTHKETK